MARSHEEVEVGFLWEQIKSWWEDFSKFIGYRVGICKEGED